MSATLPLTEMTLDRAYVEYDRARLDYIAATRMDVLTPEGVGTFGGVWDCDGQILLRSLLLAIQRGQEAHQHASGLSRALDGLAITIVDVHYGETPPPHADFGRTANGSLVAGDRYLTSGESDIVDAVKARLPNYTRDGNRHFSYGQETTIQPWPPVKGDYFSPGRCVDRWIRQTATNGDANSPANCLVNSYLTGWPICSEQSKVDACLRVAQIYRTLTECFLEAAMHEVRETL